MISKIGSFSDQTIERQVDEIVAHQFLNEKRITATFTVANNTEKISIGYRVDRFVVIDLNADIRIWRVSSDDRYLYLAASGAGSATMIVWKD
jgi:hypothetical protein